MRSCENEKLIKDTGIKESIRNIKRLKLQNEELQDRIDHERDVVSWLDRLKGISKPFKPKKDYTIDIKEDTVSDESSE
jgi:Geminin.